MENFFDWRGHWHELANAQTTLLEAAQRRSDPVGQANARIARSCTRMCRYGEGLIHLRAARTLFEELYDKMRQVSVECSIGYVLSRIARHQEALAHDQRALGLFRACGNAAGEARTLNSLGYQLTLRGA